MSKSFDLHKDFNIHFCFNINNITMKPIDHDAINQALLCLVLTYVENTSRISKNYVYEYAA